MFDEKPDLSKAEKTIGIKVFICSLIAFCLNLLLPKFLVFFAPIDDIAKVLPFSLLGLSLGSFLNVFSFIKKLKMDLGLFLGLIGLNGAIYLYPNSYLLYSLFCLVMIFIGFFLGQAFRDLSLSKAMIIDMLGAISGVLLFFFAIDIIGAEHLLLILTLLSVVPLVGRKASLVLAGAMIAPLFFSSSLDIMKMARKMPFPQESELNKFLYLKNTPKSYPVAHRWSSLNRVDAVYQAPRNEYALYFDNRKFTVVGNMKNPGVGYQFRFDEASSAFIVGVGGGKDIQELRNLGYKNISGAEINWSTIRLMTEEPMRSLSGQIYDQARILPYEGRQHLSSISEKYDYISMNFVNLPYLRNVPIFFSESVLYTTEGIATLFERLTEQGHFMISKFMKDDIHQNPEAFRIVLTIANYLRGQGKNPQDHLILLYLKETGRVNIYASLSPWTAKNLALINSSLKERKLDFLFPGYKGDSKYDRHAQLAKELIFGDLGGAEVEEKYDAYIEEVSDDRPYFYNFTRTNLWNSYYLFFSLIVLVIFLLMLAAHFYQVRSRPLTISKPLLLKSFAAISFFGLGCGFLQITLIYNLSLCFAHPVYTTSLVLVWACAGGVLAVLYPLALHQKKHLFSSLLFHLGLCAYISLLAKNGGLLPQVGGRIWLLSLLTIPIFFISSRGFLLGLDKLKTKDPKIIPFAYAASSLVMVGGMVAAYFILFLLGNATSLLLAILPFWAGIFFLKTLRTA